MHVVAITRLHGSMEAEADALAADLGTLAYSARLTLRAGVPAVVLETADGDQAAALAARLRQRGHGALACDTADVAAARDLTLVRHFRFEPTALVVRTSAGDDALAWADITALVRATHRTEARDVKVVSERTFDAGRAILTGGLSMSKNVKREVVTRTDESEPVLYLFRRGGPPWLLGQYRANYDGLGAELQPTAIANFVTTVARLRARAPRAHVDDRLLARRTTTAELDLLAHLLVAGLAQA